MPELPEVETTVRGLQRVLVGKKITDVWTDYLSPFHKGKDNIKDPAFFAQFKKEIVGQKVTSVGRRAKNILIHLESEQTILIHMKMTGHLLYGRYEKKNIEGGALWMATESGPLQDPFNRFIHLVFTLGDKKHEIKHLAFSDMRKFAKVTLFPRAHLATHADLALLGPEPLHKNFTYKQFVARLHTKPKGRIKQVLMDQQVIAGIGNIYSDEILWYAGVHPESRPAKIPAPELKKMFVATREILERSISLGGDSMSDFRNLEGEKGSFHPYHNAYMQHKKPCTKRGCKSTLIKKKIAGRSAHFCPTHQKMF